MCKVLARAAQQEVVKADLHALLQSHHAIYSVLLFGHVGYILAQVSLSRLALDSLLSSQSPV